MISYNFQTGSIIEFLTALAALLTILLLWRYRKSAEVRYLIYLELLIIVWAITYAFEFGTQDLSTKVFWSKMSYLGIAYAPLAYFLFTTAFSQKGNIINPRNVSLLSILPFITIIMVFTNEYHHLVWTDVVLDEKLNMAIYFHGTWFWIFFAYAQLLIFSGLFNLLTSIYKFTSYYKSQVATLLIASLIPIVSNLMYVTRINPIPGFDWTPLSFVFTGIVIAFGVIRYRMFDLVPNARNKLIDTMDDGVMVINAEGFIEDCNPAMTQILDLNRQSTIYKSFDSVFSDLPNLTKSIKQKSKQSLHVDLDYYNERKYYQIQIFPIFNHRNKYSGNFLTFHDISTIKKTEEKLKKTNSQLKSEIVKREKLIKSLDSFGHTLAHDLRNLLGSIYSSSEVLEEGIQNDDKELLKEMVEIIKDSAGKTIKITKELLILATVSHQNVNKKPLKMDLIISEAHNQLKEQIESSRAIINLPETWPVALGYAPWIEDVWVNYLSNAIKYGGIPPVISVGAEETDDDNIKFWIKDNGNGIVKSEQPKLFKKYTRLDPEKAQGYGLGLSIVNQIIDKLEGTVGVESTGKEGEGALFYFILPKA